MTSEFEKNLEKYAELIVKTGLNLQSGQRLLIGSPTFDSLTPLDAAPLVNLVAKYAYQIGARFVDVIWTDQQLELIRLQHAPRDSFSEYPTWQINAVLDYLKRGDALLLIYAHNPDLLTDQDPNMIAMMQQTGFTHSQPIMDYIERNAINWLVVSVPVAGWAAKVFPNVPVGNQNNKLWDTIFEICRVKQADPVAAWQGHIRQLARRSDYLNQKQYKSLHMMAPGTDLTINLPKGHLWRGGQLKSENNIPFIPNMPTEEVFTLPHKDQVDGFISSTKPLSYGGALIEDFTLTFRAGRVIKAVAKRGEESLQKLLDTDEGASRIGEVSFVPHNSPVSRSGLLFYNILIDENASNHIALGNAYKFSIDKGEALSDEEFAAVGGNQSAIHIDFMVGSGAMNVDGIKEDKGTEPIMRNGEWSFEIREENNS
jgi:aminopeptidase